MAEPTATTSLLILFVITGLKAAAIIEMIIKLIINSIRENASFFIGLNSTVVCVFMILPRDIVQT